MSESINKIGETNYRRLAAVCSCLMVFVSLCLGQTPTTTLSVSMYQKVSSAAIETAEPMKALMPADTVTQHEIASRPLSRWRINTNLLYWAALAHNVGVEYRFSPTRYLTLNGACAWWSRRKDWKFYRWMVGELAYMRNFTHCERNSGWQAGTYVQTGEFEFMNGGPKNRKGEFTTIGLSIGYRWKIRRRSALHAELGLGYMYIDYRYATPIDGRLIHEGRKFVNYFGPTRASLSWVWYFKGKRRTQ